MANTNEEFDQQFRKKLDEHREKPSALAWERLESQLPKQYKRSVGMWWAIAASVTALVVATYSLWPGEKVLSDENLLASQTEIPKEEAATQSEQLPVATEEISTNEEKTARSAPKNLTNKQPESIPNVKSNPAATQKETTKQLIAQADIPKTEAPLPSTSIELKTAEPQLTATEIPIPEIQKTVAEAKPQAQDEPLYRVSIYSDGVKKGEPSNKNLITELGKTVGQMEGLLGKVDDGLISIQEKKDNLFANLTTKKDRADQKP